MKFEIDKQTLTDLEIFETGSGAHCIFNLFNRTHTQGGWFKLKALFANPATDAKTITDRQELLKYLESFGHPVLVSGGDNEFIEYYLNQNLIKASPSKINALRKSLVAQFNYSNEYYIVKKGIGHTLDFLRKFHQFINQFNYEDCPEYLKDHIDSATNILEQDDFKKALSIVNSEKLTAIEVGFFDNLFRESAKADVLALFQIWYDLDCHMAIATAANELNFCYPEILTDTKKTIEVTGLFHPLLTCPVTNDMKLNSSKNVTLLTGPNMAGKSTFLKSIGIAIYLTHLGLPVPAAEMKVSVFNGLVTTINLFDNLHQGYSHFYSEVMRVKEVALKINTINNIFVIFDELFRGTNVKDAYDGSLAITDAFTKVPDNLFIISTHIVEIAEGLATNNAVDFISLDVQMQDGVPRYNYKLNKGVSKERLGMYIIQKEKIIETIKQGIAVE